MMATFPAQFSSQEQHFTAGFQSSDSFAAGFEMGIPVSGDKTFVHEQAIASEIWSVTHGLGKYPSVTVVDSANNIVIGWVTYTGINTVTIRFTAPFAGKAYFN